MHIFVLFSQLHTSEKSPWDVFEMEKQNQKTKAKFVLFKKKKIKAAKKHRKQWNDTFNEEAKRDFFS